MRRRSIHRTAIAFCSLIVLIAFAFTATAAKEGEAPRSDTSPRWEHLALVHNSPDVAANPRLSEKINSLGDKGWELVDVSTVVVNGNTTSTVFYFKRPK